MIVVIDLWFHVFIIFIFLQITSMHRDFDEKKKPH